MHVAWRGNEMKIIINETQRGTTKTAREMRAMQFMSVFSCFFLPSNSQLKWKCANFAVRCVLNQFLVRAGNVKVECQGFAEMQAGGRQFTSQLYVTTSWFPHLQTGNRTVTWKNTICDSLLFVAFSWLLSSDFHFFFLRNNQFHYFSSPFVRFVSVSFFLL